MSGAYEIRRAHENDLAEILALQGASTQVVHWSEALWKLLLQQTVDGAALRCVWVALMEREVANRELVGFAVLGGAAEFAELEMVLVSTVLRGNGIGRGLCHEAMQWATKQGAKSLELEVRASNHVALAMYESLGFTRQGIRRDYYRDPIEDAVLMTTSLTSRDLPSPKV